MDSTGLLSFFLLCFTSLFTIMNPLSAAAVFVPITALDSAKKRRSMAKRASIVAGAILIFFGLAGNLIFRFFSITLDAFIISGGLLLVYRGFKMFHSSEGAHTQNPEEREEAVRKSDISIVPMAMPLLSGPGAIATTLAYMGRASSKAEVGMLILSIAAVTAVSMFILMNAESVTKRLGENGLVAMNRIMGLIVIVIGVQFILNGIEGTVLRWLSMLLF